MLMITKKFIYAPASSIRDLLIPQMEVTFSAPKRSLMGPFTRSRLEEPGILHSQLLPRLDANSTMKVICLHTLSNIYTPENERMTMENQPFEDVS